MNGRIEHIMQESAVLYVAWKGHCVRAGFLVPAIIALAIAGCGSSSNGPATPHATPTSPGPSSTPSETNPSGITATPTYTVGKPYARFVASLCHDFATKNANGIISVLPYFQYNNGLRWGKMGDGEGTTSDPSQMKAWLASSNVHCTYFTPGQNGHGTVLATGWAQPGPSALAELDIYPDGHWKINDFTFGNQQVLYNAMQTAGPPLRFRG